MNESERLEPAPLMQPLPVATDSNSAPPGCDIGEFRKLALDLCAVTPLSSQSPAKQQGASNLVVFAGPSGTGKTMAAQALAGEAGSDIFRIDTTQVVSKYIGETEKNLSVIFANASNSDPILFFDEADSLFGKRAEVKDSHDRYANIAAYYLLELANQYSGIVILACSDPVIKDARVLEFQSQPE